MAVAIQDNRKSKHLAMVRHLDDQILRGSKINSAEFLMIPRIKAGTMRQGEINYGDRNMSDSHLPPEILGLPVSARLILVEQLWDSIALDEQAFELSAAQQAELDRRLELRRTSPERGSAWSVVKQRLLNQS